jgi:hypothetical protein
MDKKIRKLVFSPLLLTRSPLTQVDRSIKRLKKAMEAVTLAIDDGIENISASIYRAVDLDIDYQSAMKVLLVSNEQRALMDYVSNQQGYFIRLNH